MEAQTTPKKFDNRKTNSKDSAEVKEAEKTFLNHRAIKCLIPLLRRLAYLVGVYNSYVLSFMKLIDNSLSGNFIYLTYLEDFSKRMKFSTQKPIMGQRERYKNFVRSEQEWISANLVSELNAKFETVKLFLIKNIPSIKKIMKNFEGLDETQNRRNSRKRRGNFGKGDGFELFPNLVLYSRPRQKKVYLLFYKI